VSLRRRERARRKGGETAATVFSFHFPSFILLRQGDVRQPRLRLRGRKRRLRAPAARLPGPGVGRRLEGGPEGGEGQGGGQGDRGDREGLLLREGLLSTREGR